MKGKRTLFALFLAFALTLSPVWAGFADVSPDAWYAGGAALCAEKGVLIGDEQGLFLPEETLSHNQCVTLALRLHDLLHGGDGVLEAPPEDWGKVKVTVTLADGQRIALNGDAVSTHPSPVYYSKAPVGTLESVWSLYIITLADLSPEDAALLKANEAATIWEDALGHRVEMSNLAFSTEKFLYFGALNGGDDEFTLEGAPDPDKWWRDGAWYLAQHPELEGVSYWNDEDGEATRTDFAKTLYAAVGKLPSVRQVDIPDVEREYFGDAVYALYEAGVLTGKDVYGTFGGETTLTRGEAAVMAARVLDETRRVSTPLAPLPTDGYTLTYLQDGEPDCGVTYPLCVLGSWEENAGHEGLLTLDGVLHPWPGRVQSSGLMPHGDYLGIAVMDETTENLYDYHTGVLDGQGNWVVPLGDVMDWDALFEGLSQEVARPYTCSGVLYQDEDGHPVSQKFDWAGELSADGRGFVGLDGKIYRIQFN